MTCRSDIRRTLCPRCLVQHWEDEPCWCEDMSDDETRRELAARADHELSRFEDRDNDCDAPPGWEP